MDGHFAVWVQRGKLTVLKIRRFLRLTATSWQIKKGARLSAQVGAAFGGGLCRRGGDGPLGRGWWYRPSGDEYIVSVTGMPFLYHIA